MFCTSLCTTAVFPHPAYAALSAQNFNALYQAASHGKVHVISRALARGLDIDSTDDNGDTGLCRAIRNNDKTAYRVFMHFGANPNHSCILTISRSQYSRFMASVPSREIEYTSASARYANTPVQNVNTQYQNNLYSSGWTSSPVVWTVGGLALVAGGIALAGSGGGSGGNKNAAYYYSNNNSGIGFDLSALNGVSGAPFRNQNNITADVIDSADADPASLWGIYATDNYNIVNTANINITANDNSYNKEHWGGIYSKNGYIFNAGVITIQSDNYYAAGLMACVVNSYNPANTACFVNSDNAIAGDVYNAGTINIKANQSSGIFTGDVRNVTNAGTISMNGSDNTGIFIYGNANNVTNDGVIKLEGEGSDYLAGSMNGIWAAGTTNLTNNKEITINNSNYTASGMYNKDGTITNNGTITIEGNGAGLKTNDGTLINNNIINITNSNNRDTYGMKVDNAGSATNYGEITITGSGYGMYITDGYILNDTGGKITLTGQQGYAMAGNGTNNGLIYSSAGGMSGSNVINNNYIQSTGNGLTGISSAVNKGTIESEGLGIDGDITGSITNTGTIKSAIGTYTQEGSTSNSGTIETESTAVYSIAGNIDNSGTIYAKSGSAIDVSQSTITNTSSGTITSDGTIAVLAHTGSIPDPSSDKDKTIPANLTLNNEGTISLTNGGTAILVSGSEENPAKLTLNNSGSIIIDNVDNTGALTAVSSITAKSTADITNTGTITINNYDSGIDNVITGIETINGTVTNDGTITINNNYFDGDTKRVIGIRINEGEAVNGNNGTIIINSNNAIGMMAEYTGDDEVKDGEVKVKATNNGTIEMNGTNNIAMYAANKGAVITNAGTIIIKKPNLTDIYQKYGDTVYSETDTCNSFICLVDGGTYVNSGNVVSDGDINFNDINGLTLLSVNSKISAASISGLAYANYDLVTGSFEDVYTTDEDSLVGDTENLEIKSYSSMFNANLTGTSADTNRGIVLSRKSFYEFTPNTYAAQYLEANYKLGNNLAFYDDLKASTENGSITKKIDQTLGLKLFPSFSKQVLDSLRIINTDISNSVLANQDNSDIRILSGWNTHYREQDKTADQYGFTDRLQSLFGMVDKKHDNGLRTGLGINYARSDAKYDDNNKRTNNLIQLFAPFIYQNALYQFMSTPHVGFLWGKYTRHTDNASYHADTKEYYYGITNQLRRDIALERFILEPGMELNFAGLYTSDIKEAHGLNVDSHNDLSVELGIGLYAKKTFEFDENNSLSVRAGGSTYLELLSPYRNLYGSMNGMNGSYRFNRTANSKTRSVLSTGVNYRHGQMNLIGELNKYIEDTDGYEINCSMQYGL